MLSSVLFSVTGFEVLIWCFKSIALYPVLAMNSYVKRRREYRVVFSDVDRMDVSHAVRVAFASS
jgi:hypothetical protein